MSQVKLLERSVDTKRRMLGSLEIESGAKRMKLPLKAVELTGRVADRLAHVTVKETFTNPYSEHLEAVYIFPLSGGCAVSSFEMRVADRVVKGKIEERGAARAQYAEALQEGKRAALLEQERDDVFTVQVGNLPPGEEITVVITYSEKLAYFEDGTTEIRLPLVVAPRFMPGSPLDRDSVGDGIELDTDQVPDASRISPPRLAAGAKAKIDLNLKVVIAGDQTIEDLGCSQHATKMGTSKDGITVSLAREDELLDRDFVLRWRVATDVVQSKFLIYRNPEDKTECYGMLSLVPPKCTEIASAPRDVIFVVDRSGSMNGIKMVSAARACSYLLSTLTPKDKFAIQAFDTMFEWMPTTDSQNNFLEADESGIQEGMDYLRKITARGGTLLEGALSDAIASMSRRKKKAGRQAVIVVLTDGEVGNEANIIANIQRELSDLRVFTVGIDTAVNDGLLRKLAAVGGGTCTFVAPGTQLEGALSQVSREIGTPLIQELSIEDINCGFDEDSIAPETIPDLFEGRAINSFFRLTGAKLKDLGQAKIRVKGEFNDGTPFLEEVSAKVTDVAALAQLWAKAHIVDLEDKFRLSTQTGPNSDRTVLQKKIVATAIQHSLLTKFTAFVVVDESEIVNADGNIKKIVQPVENPALWELQQQPQQQVAQMLNLMGGNAGAGNARSASFASLGQTYGSPAPGWGAPAAGGMQPPSAPQSAPPPAGLRFQSQPAPSNEPGQGGNADSWSAFTPASPTASDMIRAESLRRKESQSVSGQAVGKFKKAAEPDEVKSTFERLAKLLSECFEKIKKGEMPDADQLESARTDLLTALAKSPRAASLPLLQKYLRSDLIKLIAAIAGATVVNKQLQNLCSSQQKSFEALRSESIDGMQEPTETPFWTSTV